MLSELDEDDEPKKPAPHPGARLGEHIEHILLVNNEVDTSVIPYDFDGFHVGAIAVGSGAVEALQNLARVHDRRLLTVPRENTTVWGWFGSRQRPDLREFLDRWATPKQVTITVGETGKGLAGFRLTHRQALAAATISHVQPDTVIRYADHAVLASILRDELLVMSLWTLYLEPLENARDQGQTARETLRAYFNARGNVSSTAQALNVDRRTVSYRLRKIELAFDTPIHRVATEVELALRLHEAGAYDGAALPNR